MIITGAMKTKDIDFKVLKDVDVNRLGVVMFRF